MIVENRDRKEFRLPHSNRCVSPWPDPALDTMALNIITHEQAPKSDKQTDPQDVEPCQDPPLGQIGRKSGVFNVIISGLALLSDGYNAQISKSNLLLVSVMFMTNSFSWIHGAPLLRFVCIDTTVFRAKQSQPFANRISARYKDGMSSSFASRLSNSYLIGEIVGMLFFGVLIDRIGRRTGIVVATVFLILGIVLATAAHGKSEFGYVVLTQRRNASHKITAIECFG